MLAKIYSSSKQGFDIPSVTFSNDVADTFFIKWNKLKSKQGIEHNNIMNSIFDKHEKKLYFRAERLSHFANLCKTDYSHFYFTHGDAGGNILVTDEKYYIIDWDEVMYAPPERDAWVMSCREWAMNAFNDSLNQNGIDYKLRNERIAFYCYHMFFQYLNELLNDFFLSGQTKEIEEYFDCWIEERIQYADSLQ